MLTPLKAPKTPKTPATPRPLTLGAIVTVEREPGLWKVFELQKPQPGQLADAAVPAEPVAVVSSLTLYPRVDLTAPVSRMRVIEKLRC